tara:strand:+ start:299 stop:1357 length:1059 start_codon:yes stop_codon:yes gene_type:complete
MQYKVLHVIDRLDVGGAEKVTVMLTNLLAQRSHDIGLLTIVDSGRLIGNIDNHVKHINLNRRSKWHINTALNFMVIASDYDLIHVHLRHNLNWILFWSIILRKKLNIVYHHHSNAALKWNILYSIQRCNISHVIVNKSLYSSQSSVNLFPHRVYFLENIINPVPALGEYVRKEDEIALIVVSNLRRLKNIEFAIKLANYFAKRKKLTLDIYYIHFEKGYLEELQDLSKNLGIQLEINFINGEIEPQLFYHKYDLALHPSTRESGPLTILEYIAHGLPFISYNTGQSIALVKKKYPEFITGTFNTEEWIRSFEMIASRGRLYYEIQLKDFFQQHYSSMNYYTECRKIYKENLT